MFRETLLQALAAILRNALRSFLTVLGVIIGVAAVIAMVTIGRGSTVQIESDVSKLGTNLLMVRPGLRRGPAGSGRPATPFTTRDVEAIRTQVAGVETVAPMNVQAMTIVSGNENYTGEVTGTDNSFFAARDWKLAEGREFFESEIRSGAAVCILGETVRKEIFGSGNPMGEKIRIEQISCRVIGLLTEKGASAYGSDQDDVVLMPARTFMRRVSGKQEVRMIYVGVKQGVSTARVQSAIETLLRERRRIRPGDEDDFRIRDTKEITSMLTGVTGVMTGLLSAVAAVSLLVGGIGIMNIMLVSVTERTREIGIRLAIGATETQVLMQFLVEAVVLSLIGGLIGIGFGLGLGYVGAIFMKVPFAPDWSVAVLAFVFSAFIGIIFGYFPARRAARLDPIEALHHE
ncbi:multidrug ABC transporter substrate-binding protein [Zhengella mangrovi]|uniref:Multidrug ABC transporter substrate-binding protein n=1 Tax=Zhengella mangrovi TaxID=1982044 RepID=A0A2G1QU88_9HYPH|nr:ABC transporter permease [Zhengella mangrovi]PHP69024.1 multidrug ABC transporter substrate-binding protein [Zhengella mangrovi]